MSGGIPPTLLRLSSLKPGERMIYYRGEFESDVKRCDPAGSDIAGAPSAKRLLIRIQLTAAQLASEGRVKLDLVRVEKGRARFYEYVAEGLP